MSNLSEKGPFGSRQWLIELAHQFLETNIISGEKLEQRRLLLASNPELRRKVDIPRLKKIINFLDFKCHPNSSIARNEAIEGSDIDGGLVILKKPAPIEEQFAFIAELRVQGFSVYHLQEYENIASMRDKAETAAEKSQFTQEMVIRNSRKILFHTWEELEVMIDDLMTYPQAFIYLAGTSIT